MIAEVVTWKLNLLHINPNNNAQPHTKTTAAIESRTRPSAQGIQGKLFLFLYSERKSAVHNSS